MRERPPSHNPRSRPSLPLAPPEERELATIFEDLWTRRFTGKLLLHFHSGYPSLVDQLPHRPGRRWRIRRPTP